MTTKLAFFLFLIFVAYSTEKKNNEETLMQRLHKKMMKQRLKDSQKRYVIKVQKVEQIVDKAKLQAQEGSLQQNFLVPNVKREKPKERLKMTSIICKPLNILPNQSSVKVLRDLKTNEISWEDPNELISIEIKDEIGSCLQQNGKAMSNGLFDVLSEWFTMSQFDERNWNVPLEARPFVKELLYAMSKHVDVAKRTKSYNETPLMLATILDVDKAVVKLIERGANMGACDEYGENSLHIAAFFGSELSLKILLQKGAHINAQNENGTTPLMYAARQERNELVSFLLESGADVRIKDNNGLTASQYANRNYADVIEAETHKKLFSV